MNENNLKLGAFVASAVAIAVGFVFFLVQSGKIGAAGAAETSKEHGITFVMPTPAAIRVLWTDSAGNIGMRGVEAVVPGAPDEHVQVTLNETGLDAAAVQKAIAQITGKSMKDAAALLGGVHQVLKDSATPEEAADIQKKIEAAGGKVEITPLHHLTASCFAAAKKNGEGTLTICTNKDVGKVLKAELGKVF